MAGFYTLFPGLQVGLKVDLTPTGRRAHVFGCLLLWGRGFLEELAGRKPHVGSFHWTCGFLGWVRALLQRGTQERDPFNGVCLCRDTLLEKCLPQGGRQQLTKHLTGAMAPGLCPHLALPSLGDVTVSLLLCVGGWRRARKGMVKGDSHPSSSLLA